MVEITPTVPGLQPDIINGKDKEDEQSTKMNENNGIYEHKSYFTGTMSTMQSTVRKFEVFGHKVNSFHAHLWESIATIDKKHAAAHDSLRKTLESGMRKIGYRNPLNPLPLTQSMQQLPQHLQMMLSRTKTMTKITLPTKRMTRKRTFC